MAILRELKSRGVIQTAALYIAVAWGGTEILTFLIEALLGEGTAAVAKKYFAILFIAGFPVAMYLAWTRDLGMRARRFASAMAMAVFFVAVLVWLVPTKTTVRRVNSASPNTIASVAVLPLENLSNEPDQEFFAAGMTEALIAELSQFGLFNVISRTSVMQYKGTTKSVPEIADELGVDAVVEGSVFRSGDQVRITAQLIEAASDSHLWADSFEGNLEDVLSLQYEAAKSMVQGIGATLDTDAAPIAKPRPVNPAAYDAYLQARLMFLEAQGAPKPAIAAAERAIQLDPTFAPAYTLLSNLYGYLALTTNITDGDAYLQARHLAQRAIELDPDLAESRFAMARVLYQFEWNWGAAESEFTRGLELDPNNARGLTEYGGFRVLVHRDCDGGLAMLRRVRDLDPFNPGAHFNLGVYSFHCGYYPETIRHMERTSELSPGFYWPRMVTAWANFLDGSEELAVQQCDDLFEEIGAKFEVRALGSCIWIYENSGRDAKAQALMGKLLDSPTGIHVNPLAMSYAYCAFGDLEKTYGFLEQAFRERTSDMIFLRTMPAFNSIRTQPRFKAIMKKMNFPGEN